MIAALPDVETHHLVPLKYADCFDVSLDVPENYVVRVIITFTSVYLFNLLGSFTISG
jgi:hypothetical protein